MATVVVFTGFEYGTAAGVGTGTAGQRVWDGITGTAGTDVDVVAGTPTGGVGSYVGQVALTGKNFFWDTNTLGASQTDLVVSMRFRLTVLPTGDTDVISMDRAGTTDAAGFFYKASTGQLVAWIGASSQASAATLSVNTWYTLQWKYNCLNASNTLDWQLDGVAGTQVTGGAASTIARLAIGNRSAGSGTAQYDDVVASVTGADHPLAVHQVRMLIPDTGGTTTEIGAANSTARFVTNNTIDATHNSADILAAISEVPPTIGASASGVAQRVVGSTEAVGIPMTTYTLAAGETLAASRVILCGWANGTLANNLGVRVHNGTSETTLTPGNTASSFTNSTTAPDWYGKLYTGATTQAHIDAMVVRIGYSTDISPQPGAHAVYVELLIASSGVAAGPSARVAAVAAQPLHALPGSATLLAPRADPQAAAGETTARPVLAVGVMRPVTGSALLFASRTDPAAAPADPLPRPLVTPVRTPPVFGGATISSGARAVETIGPRPALVVSAPPPTRPGAAALLVSRADSPPVAPDGRPGPLVVAAAFLTRLASAFLTRPAPDGALPSCDTPRPFTGTTTRPAVGLTTRPDTGTTSEPC